MPVYSPSGFKHLELKDFGLHSWSTVSFPMHVKYNGEYATILSTTLYGTNSNSYLMMIILRPQLWDKYKRYIGIYLYWVLKFKKKEITKVHQSLDWFNLCFFNLWSDKKNKLMWEIKRPVKYVCGAGTSLMHSIVLATNGGQRNALSTIQKWEESFWILTDQNVVS